MNQALQGAARAGILDRTVEHWPGREPRAGFASGWAGIDFRSPADIDQLPRPFPDPAAKWAQPGMKVTELLGEQDVVLGLSAKGKRSALARVAATFSEEMGRTQGSVLAALLRRERLGSTAIGRGVAIPHARLDGLSVPKAMIATLRRPVWFGAPDNDPVDLLFAILWPKSDDAGFLPALAQISRLLRHPDLRCRIRASETPAEALGWLGSFERPDLSGTASTLPVRGVGPMVPSQPRRISLGSRR